MGGSCTLTATTVTTYTYPSTVLRAGDDANRLDYFYQDGAQTDLAWDDNGNLLTQGTSVYTWDAANRLVSADVDGVVSTFAYNGLGQRTSQTVGGVTTEYVLDVATGLPEVIVATTGGASTYYVQIQGQILAQQDSGAWTYVLPDHLGSVRQLTNAGGQVTLAQSYDPFGNLFEAAGSGASEFGYTGELWDVGTELVFLRARYYDPVVGRFLSQDSFPGFATSPQTQHPFTYVTNNPVNRVDPSGYQGGPAAGTAGGGIMVCFGIAFLVPEPFLELGCGFLLAMGLIAGMPVVGSVLDEGVTIEDTIHSFPRAPELDPLPPFELGSHPDPLDYNPGPSLDAGLEQTLKLPGFPTDQAEPTTSIYDFPLVQPCLEDSLLLAFLEGNVRYINPAELRWTQRTAGGRGRAAQLRQSMLEKGWDGPPIDVVETADGLVTVDHTRAAIALELGMDRIPARVHQPDEPLPPDMVTRARFRAADGTVAKTWGEAIAIRAGRQRPPLPSNGTDQVPRLPLE